MGWLVYSYVGGSLSFVYAVCVLVCEYVLSDVCRYVCRCVSLGWR